MKNYFKRTNTEQHIMIDNDSNYVVIVYSAPVVKTINVVTNIETFNNYVSESTDETKMISVTESDFNNIKNIVISAI
jgi:hypothetical protein